MNGAGGSSASVRDARAGDGAALARIYNPYIEGTIITFEEERVDAAEMDRRVHALQSAGMPWIVAELEGELVGYAYAAKWRERAAYRSSRESSVYLDPARAARGLGSQLYADLLERLRVERVHAVIGGISLPNAASVALHEKFGFEKVAHFPQVGFKCGRWVDVGYWQKLL